MYICRTRTKRYLLHFCETHPLTAHHPVPDKNFQEKPLLAVETATPVCSVALRLPDGRIIEERDEGRGVHSRRTLQFADRLLRDSGCKAAGLGGVFLSAGPGSYTGLRVGASALKGLVFRTGVPFFACHTLGLIALGAFRLLDKAGKGGPGLSCEAVIDARRQHFYHQRWRLGQSDLCAETPVQIMELDKVCAWRDGGRFVAGTGLERLPPVDVLHSDATLLQKLQSPELIRATHVLEFVGKNPDHIHRADTPGGSQSSSTRSIEPSQEVPDRIIRAVSPEYFEPFYYSGL